MKGITVQSGSEDPVASPFQKYANKVKFYWPECAGKVQEEPSGTEFTARF
jgi:hypothetical protein